MHLKRQASGARAHRRPGRLHPGAQAPCARVRHRTGRDRQDLARGRPRGRAVRAQAGRPDHPLAARRRGRRTARLPARRHAREGRSLPAADLRRAVRPDGCPHRRTRPAERRDRDRAACLHARPHARECGGHPRRGAEHDLDADEDVPDPAGREQPHDRDRGSEPGRPAARPDLGPARGAEAARQCRGRRPCRFTAQDVVRHELVARIVEAYDRASAAARSARPRNDREHAAGPCRVRRRRI